MNGQKKERQYNESLKEEISKLVETAKAYLPEDTLPFDVIFERIGDGTFQDVFIGAVFSSIKQAIIINADWYESTDEQDIKYLVWHETRHAYQKTQIEKQKQGFPTSEARKRIKKWKWEFENYIPNELNTEEAHMTQDIEIDAYAFAVYLLFNECPNNDGSIKIGLPPCIENEIMQRVYSQKGGIYRCS